MGGVQKNTCKGKKWGKSILYIKEREREKRRKEKEGKREIKINTCLLISL
jgi:hypothetical protein